jgi:hypothetical protein
MISELLRSPSTIHEFSDARLVHATGDRLAVPRVGRADSFVLHSALELLARAALLPFVDPAARPAARARFVELGDQFERFDEPVQRPATREFDNVADAARLLVDALDRSELDDVDAAAAWLGRTASPMQLRDLLADALVPSLAAAGHAPIFLYLLPRVAARGEATGELVRQLARELARHPGWRLTWFERSGSDQPIGSAEALTAALAATPRLGDPPSAFIHPLMARIDTSDAAAAWLGHVTTGVDIHDRSLGLLRVAAWSMICEPTRHAPYGWSHCLTMPQAVLGVAHSCSDPSTALAVAATYVAGFRTLADGPLVMEMVDSDPQMPVHEAIATDPRLAAAAAWYDTPRDQHGVMTTLATIAGVHADAHLVKYTLACFDAAAADPSSRRLYMAAAASLASWWTVQAGQLP